MKHSANYIQAPFQVEATDCEHIIIELVNAHSGELPVYSKASLHTSHFSYFFNTFNRRIVQKQLYYHTVVN